MTKRTWLLVFLTLSSVASAALLPALPQPLSYHDFADQRTMFGVERFQDVASNIGFVVVGIAGLAIVTRRRTRFEFAVERLPYAAFFTGMVLTAAGSAWYHMKPDNETLAWDRLPMTVAFMSLIAAQVVERISIRAGIAMLVPLLIIGTASVVYWIATERADSGNVVPYLVLQIYAVAALLLIAATHPSRYTRGSDIYWVFGAYIAAKLLEYLDREILALGHLVSGHSLKHLAAALAGLVVCRTLMLRTVRSVSAAPVVGR